MFRFMFDFHHLRDIGDETKTETLRATDVTMLLYVWR